MAGFYMRGEALSWFKLMFHNQQLTNWFSFLRALELHFGPSSFENHQGELFKLRKLGSVSDYQSQFEKICNRTVGLSPNNILNCFIFGLHANIKGELAILKPTSISQAIGLAKLVESKLKDSRPKTSRFPTPTTKTTPTPPITSNSPSSSLPIHRLSPSQLQERRIAGLCYNCDEKFVPGHKCASPHFLLLLTEDLPTFPDTDLHESRT
uniref:Retrotransposon gag domain-containing protein n=1 Tax=Cajanus cajan TaxID=3821 RepID=A0A151SNZ7_CAJCA|nr:hypothetical protein KK1_002795 [Cajanus cajan]